MPKFTGSNIADVTKVRRSDVFTDVQQTVVGTVNVPDVIEVLPLATLLTSVDGGKTWTTLTTPHFEVRSYAVDEEVYFKGHIFKSTADDNDTTPGDGDWDDLGRWDANGVLYNDLTESKKTTVVVTGTLREKYLHGSDDFLRVSLFINKIIAK